MAGSLLDKLRALLADADTPDTPDTPGENPEPVGQGENPSGEPDASDIDPSTDELAVSDTPPDTPADSPAAPAADELGDGGNTIPETPGPSDAERDIANDVAAQNEALRLENQRLRDRIAELGGDAALGIVEETPDPADTPDVSEDYDEDSDIAAQEAEIAALKNL